MNRIQSVKIASIVLEVYPKIFQSSSCCILKHHQLSHQKEEVKSEWLEEDPGVEESKGEWEEEKEGLPTSGEGNLSMRARVHGKEELVLIDTGASTSFISKKKWTVGR